MENENRNALEARIRYRSHRGMLELDLILVPFSQQLSKLTHAELIQMDELLEEQDPDLHEWLMGVSQPEQPIFRALIKKIINRD